MPYFMQTANSAYWVLGMAKVHFLYNKTGKTDDV